MKDRRRVLAMCPDYRAMIREDLDSWTPANAYEFAERMEGTCNMLDNGDNLLARYLREMGYEDVRVNSYYVLWRAPSWFEICGLQIPEWYQKYREYLKHYARPDVCAFDKFRCRQMISWLERHADEGSGLVSQVKRTWKAGYRGEI